MSASLTLIPSIWTGRGREERAVGGRGPCLGGLEEDLEGGAKEELDQRRGGAPVVSPLASASTREWNCDGYRIPNPKPLASASTLRESPPPQLLLAFPLAQAES